MSTVEVNVRSTGEFPAVTAKAVELIREAVLAAMDQRAADPRQSGLSLAVQALVAAFMKMPGPVPAEQLCCGLGGGVGAVVSDFAPHAQSWLLIEMVNAASATLAAANERRAASPAMTQ